MRRLLTVGRDLVETSTRFVPGPTAAALGFRSLRWIALASFCAVPVAFESFLPAGFVLPWGVGWLVASLALLSLFLRDSVHSRRVEKQEVALGYTTALTTANSRPDLYLLDRTSRRVLARPGEPRPLNIRKKETDKALARRATGHPGEL